MIKIGLTGGIGSGKTTVASIFEVLEIPVYKADERSKYLVGHNQQVHDAIASEFGQEMFDKNGDLKRKKLSDLVFGNKSALQKLNGIVHPAVANDYKKWCESNQGVAYTIRESAILFESGANKQVDQVIMVFSPIETMIKRIMDRDGFSRVKVLEIMENQWPEQKKIDLSDDVPMSDGQQSLIKQVLTFHDSIMARLSKT